MKHALPTVTTTATAAQTATLAGYFETTTTNGIIMVTSVNGTNAQWHEWLCKSNSSFLRAASFPHELVTTARELGYASLCLNDWDGVYGLPKAFAHSSEGCPVFAGSELHLSPDHHLPLAAQHTVALVARTPRGYAHMCRILSAAAWHSSQKQPFLPLTEWGSTDDLVALVPMRGLLENQASLDTLAEHFGANLYFCISRHLHSSENEPMQLAYAAAKRYGSPLLMTQDVFYHSAERAPLQDVLTAIRLNKTIQQAKPHFWPNGERYLLRRAALWARYSPLPGFATALAHSQELAASIDLRHLNHLRYRYPQQELPPGETALSYLERQVWAGAATCYPGGVPQAISQTLERELLLVGELGFADTFLTVWEIVSWARSQGILCQGRGSAANSAICFVLGITAVNPDQFELVFERFLSTERDSPPDIDVDFEHGRREEVIQYIYRRYGKQQAAMVANVITFRRRSALRAVAHTLELAPEITEQVIRTQAHPHRRDTSLRHLTQQAASDSPGQSKRYALWGELAELLQGFPRHLGIHSGGFVISDRPLWQWVPTEPASMPGRHVVQWDKSDLERLGIFKIDILALGMLSVLRRTFAQIRRHGGSPAHLNAIPTDDPTTYAMITRGDTVGTFQIESRAQMAMLPQIAPRCFYDLVVCLAIVRPGPIHGKVIHPYLRRRTGAEAVTFPDPRLIPILERTLGIPLFQEQVMRIAVALGNFTRGEADQLRRNMGNWQPTLFADGMGPWLRKLADGMQRSGLPQDFTTGLMAQMSGFAEYGFPESHAISFALLAYASAYLKCHHPAAFLEALLWAQPMGFYPPHILIRDAQRAGVKVEPVCVNHSRWQAAATGHGPGGTVRVGLRYVHGLGRQAARRLLLLRARHGAFRSMDQFLHRTELARPDLVALAYAGAFSCFGLDYKSALWQCSAAPFYPYFPPSEPEMIWDTESALAAAERQLHTSRTQLGPHPVELYKSRQWNYSFSPAQLTLACELPRRLPGQQVNVCGQLLIRQAPPSARGMVFMTLEDETGFLNLVLTPATYRRYQEELSAEPFLCCLTTVRRHGKVISLGLKHVHPRTR